MAVQDAWVGRYRFAYDDEMDRFWRERLRAQIEDESAREAALAEVRSEAEGAEIEITRDGVIASRSRGVEFYRAPLAFDGEVARFAKPNGTRVVLARSGEAVFAEEAGKPRMRFERLDPDA